MKTHVIIPIFIPHLACPNDCVFCNQRKITAHETAPNEDEVRATIEEYLSTVNREQIQTVEIAFYGGSFTAIEMEDQNRYLDIALEYKNKGLIDKIHISTRPDYIDEAILDNLKAHKLDTIELGVQSFDDQVLKLSKRGHDSKVVYGSAKLIKDYGFELGIQLMIGLPGDSLDACIYSAKECVKLEPEIARLYPTIVIKDTQLYEDCINGTYTPLSQAEAIHRTKEMYKIICQAGINIIRVGLKSSDIINENGDIKGETFHPAFRQLVESEIAKEIIDKKLESHMGPLSIFANSKWLPNAIGNGGTNKKAWEEKYKIVHFYRDDS
ncbi:MAG: radical SAM protein, partial [Clostridia bacterium]|nr:radical SAM protein [Clostridia bacterium]